jgi:hypothetical protein
MFKQISLLHSSSQFLLFSSYFWFYESPSLYFKSQTMSNSTTHHIVSPTQTGEEEIAVYSRIVSFPKNRTNQKASSTHDSEKHLSQLTLFGSKPSSAVVKRITRVRSATFAKKYGTIITRKAHLRTVPCGCSIENQRLAQLFFHNGRLP